MNIDEWKEKNKGRRNYTHFDSKVSLNQIWNYISNSKNIEKHGFYPFIHYTKHFYKYNKKSGMKRKSREICYSAHVDRFIYQYYSYQLNQIYNKRIHEDNLNNNVIGYRDNLHKNSIHFSKQAIDFIKSNNECFIMIGDFTNFFDSLDHKYLKEMLCSLLDTKVLPNDFYAIYKNITKYATWDLEHLLYYHGLNNNSKGIEEFNGLAKALSSEDFKHLKKKNVNKNSSNFGIPQGSAISAVLSNIYMLEFDKEISKLVSKKNGFYMRYSDDFIIILPTIKNEEFKKNFENIRKIINLIPNLKLEEEKTQLFQYINTSIHSCNEEFLEKVKNSKNFINYLGFSFDGKNVSIRAKTETKYYYKLYRKTKTIIKNNGFTQHGNKINNKNLYKSYSIKGATTNKNNRGNFITYVKRAEKIFATEKEIGRIARAHMQKIRKQLKKIK